MAETDTTTRRGRRAPPTSATGPPTRSGRWRALLVAAALLVGALLGALVHAALSGDRERRPEREQDGQAQEQAKVWTCSMHPQIRMDHPGKCPICGMDLVPVGAERAGAGEHDVVTLDARARSMARVSTAPIERRLLVKELRTVGKVEVDETAVAYLTAWIEGRVDRVFADFPGTVVREGDHLVEIYSPDLYATQQELLTAVRFDRETPGTDLTSDAARRRLELWGIRPEQIEQVLKSGEATSHLTVYAPRGGTVIEKSIRAGQYVEKGDSLYTIADLSRVWLILDVYERELGWVRFGQDVEVTLESEPGQQWTGTVAFVEPVLNEATRTVRVRVVLENPEGTFKPGMFVQARLLVPLRPDGTPGPTGLEGKLVCPMHPFVVRDEPGACPVCGMDLVEVPGDPSEAGPILSVPAEAVLTTGVRQLVFVEEEPGVYRLVEPALGPRAGDFFSILSGLDEGQRVVTRGNFLLDSQLQISGRPSLLYPEGGGGGGHEGMPGMEGKPGHEGMQGLEGMPRMQDEGREQGAAPRAPDHEQMQPRGHGE